MIGKTENKARERYLRLEVLERMNTLKEELEDMSTIVKEEYLEKDNTDADIIKIKRKIKRIRSANSKNSREPIIKNEERYTDEK